MDAVEAIRTRRSIRSFTEDEVSDKLLIKIIDAARWAPSGDNAQPWIFVVIKDTQIKKKVRSFLENRALRYIDSVAGEKEFEEYEQDTRFKWIEAIKNEQYQQHVSKAPVLIVILGNTSSIYYMHDCCAATQNLILAAHAMGLGSCWIDHGIGDELTETRIRNLLSVSSDYKIVSIVAIGFLAEMPKPRPRKKIDEISFLDAYGKKWIRSS